MDLPLWHQLAAQLSLLWMLEFRLNVPVSGIAMGIIVGKDDNFKVLTDIQGLEDHYGDMDFKAAGTEKGITALQMDVKVDGITVSMLEAVLCNQKATAWKYWVKFWQLFLRHEKTCLNMLHASLLCT
jgi:polyribonucleotide nucleotidyltransferase